MLKKLSAKTNFILIGIIVGFFVGVSIRQALGDTTDVPGTVRADNLTVNMSGNAGNGLIVAAGNALVAGNVGIGTTTPTSKLDVVGDIKSTTQLCVGATCVTESELQAMKNQSQNRGAPVEDWTGTLIEKSKIGFNTFNYIFGYAQNQGYLTDGSYATNAEPYSLSLITNNLAFLNQNGITTMREIVPEIAMKDTSIFFPSAAAVIRAYQKENFTLLLALGRPTVGQDLSNNRINCMTATIDADWQKDSNKWATTLTNFMKYLKTQPGIDQSWLETHVIIEPYNEFDDLSQTIGGQCVDNNSFGTPQRAAVLQNAIATQFAQNGIANEVVAPSIATGNFQNFLRAYYQAGGGGRPNIHIYSSIADPDSIETQIKSNVNDAILGVPSQYAANSMILGEFGLPMQNSAVAEGVRRVITNINITSKIKMMLWWDYMSPDEWAATPSLLTPNFSLLTPVGKVILNHTASQSPTVTSSFSPSTISSTGSTVYRYDSLNTTHCVTTHPDGTLTWDNIVTNASFPPTTYFASQFPNGLTTTQTCYNSAGQSAVSTATLTVTNP